MRIERTRSPEVFCDRLAGVAESIDDIVRIRELVRSGRWLLCATLDIARGRQLLLEAPAGHLLGVDVPAADAWPTHYASLSEARRIARDVRLAAVSAGFSCDVKLTVSEIVKAGRPTSTAIAQAIGGRLGQALAYAMKGAA